METLDFGVFLKTIEPFNKLSANEFEKLINSLDIKYYKKNETIAQKGEIPNEYFIIAKGIVKEIDDENSSFLMSKDSFDAASILKNEYKNSYIAEEECILFSLKKEYFLELIHTNAFFEGYYLHSISKKMQELLSQNLNKELATFMATRVKEVYLHEPLIIDSSISILESAKMMSAAKSDIVIVDFKNSFGIVTNTTLREKVIIPQKSFQDPIGDIAKKGLITIDENDFLFNALLLMIEHNITRLAITRENKIIGILEQIDLLSTISSKDHLVNFQINRAKSIEELKKASDDLIYLIKSLQQKGVKVRHISKLVSDLNIKTYKKLFELMATNELLSNSSLMVLGSEGRREQTLRTDQDNALILRDGITIDNIEQITNQFSQALISFGYPPCEGNVMVSNPYWAKSLSEYKKEIANYIHTPNGNNILNLAIIFDASYVSGDEELFRELKESIFEAISDDVGFYAHFAKAILSFPTPLSLFSGFITNKHEHKDELDIKKGAIFPIVHGIRSLALEKRVKHTNTIERIKELTNYKIFTKEYATELIEAYNFLLTLRLQRQLDKIQKNQTPDNFINPSLLSKFERDLLRDTLKLVDSFKKLISHHFRLQLVS